MAFSISEQLSSDLDLFFRLPYPEIGIHLASAGGILPEKIMEFDDIINKNAEIFLRLQRKFEFKINPNLNQLVDFKSAYHKQLYIEDFADKAQKGFWSFDKTNINDPYDKSFHIVAYPINNGLKLLEPINLLETPFDLKIFENIETNNYPLGRINLFENV